MDNKQQKKDHVYSLRIDKLQMKLLKDNPQIKEDLNKLVHQYINLYLDKKDNK